MAIASVTAIFFEKSVDCTSCAVICSCQEEVNDMKTLNEVVDIVGLKRRAIQEYEDAGLADKPTTKNKYGYLLYDTPAIERLWQLRFYKELGYNMTEIKKIFDNKTYNAEDELERVVQELIKKREHLDNLISIAKAMKETGISFTTLKNTISDADLAADDVFELMGTSLKSFMDVDEKDCNIDILTDEDIDSMFDIMDRIMDLQKVGKDFKEEETQNEILQLHGIIAKGLSKSIILLESTLMYIGPESKWGEELVEIYGKEKVEYLRKALQHYCKENADNDTDREISESLDNIATLGRKKYTTNSPEVQAEVKKIHNFFNGVNLYKEEAKIGVLKKMGLLFGSRPYKQMLDKGAKRGVSWFISRAIEIYCNNLEQEEN